MNKQPLSIKLQTRLEHNEELETKLAQFRETLHRLPKEINMKIFLGENDKGSNLKINIGHFLVDEVKECFGLE
jgi:UV DNA damage repair endonuclease